MKSLVLLLLAISFADARLSYRNHKVIEVPLLNREQANVIQELEQAGIDVWTAVIGHVAHLRVSPSNLDAVIQTLSEAGMRPHVVVDDIQNLIDEEQRLIQEANEKRGRASWVGNSFVRYSEIEAWIQALPNTCGNKCAVEVVGSSYEKRNVYVIRISNDLSESADRDILFFETNIHAREWLSHSSVAYLIETLLENYGTDEKITAALNKYEWHFIVMSNPDGYEYTWTGDRLWRKTRSVQTARCYGVDPNRNFDDHHCGEGTSSNACSDIYCGPSPFSEKETQIIRDYTIAIAPRMKSFQSIHCYSQLVLLPFAYEYNAYPSNFAELSRVAKLMTDTIYATSKKSYTAGNVADLLGPAAGSTMDWVRSALNTTYVMAWELRPSRNTPNGFVVSPSEIIPTSNELLQALLVMSENI